MRRDEGTLLDMARAARAILTFVQDVQNGHLTRTLNRQVSLQAARRRSSVPLAVCI